MKIILKLFKKFKSFVMIIMYICINHNMKKACSGLEVYFLSLFVVAIFKFSHFPIYFLYSLFYLFFPFIQKAITTLGIKPKRFLQAKQKENLRVCKKQKTNRNELFVIFLLRFL